MQQNEINLGNLNRHNRKAKAMARAMLIVKDQVLSNSCLMKTLVD